MSADWFYKNIGQPISGKNNENEQENKQDEEKVNEKIKELEIEKNIYLKERDILQRKVFELEKNAICVLYDKCKVIDNRDYL